MIALEREQLSEDNQKSLETAEVGVKCLGLVPHPWKERLKPLVQHPWLQLESLVMVQQFNAAAELLATFPDLNNDAMLLRYARYSFSALHCRTRGFGKSVHASVMQGF